MKTGVRFIKWKKALHSNRGFTLVELIVVIAMMAILAGVSSNVISMVSKQELKDFTNNLDAMMTQCRMETLSGMPDPELDITVVDGEYRAILYKRENGRRVVVKDQFLGEDYLTCTYDTENSRGLAFSGTLTIRYDRYTGAFKNTNLKRIIISNGRSEFSIEMIPQTGYHRIEK